LQFSISLFQPRLDSPLLSIAFESGTSLPAQDDESLLGLKK
jgi:hypothetical protein